MTAKNSNKSVTPQKKLSFLRSALGVAVLGTSFFLTAGVNKSHAEIIQSGTENISELGQEYAGEPGGSACNHLRNVTTFMGNKAYPVRAGKYAFQEVVDRCGKRAELRGKTTEIGKTYWYGWSVFIPSDWSDTDSGWDILNQFPAYPSNNKSFMTEGCGAAGSHITRNLNEGAKIGGLNRKDQIDFVLQHAGDSAKIECNRFPLAKVSEMKGKWVDYVMNVKWTGNKDGFLKLWMKLGNGSYTQKIDYKGRTFWNDEGNGPYFKMGVYKGKINFQGPAPRTAYTDEYRLGNDKSSFDEVAPR